MTNGRRKGAAAELEVAEHLEGWWGAFEPGTRFKRTPGSGGWGDREVRGAFRTSGDLVTTSLKFPFAVEVKRREEWSMKTLRATAASPVWEWWLQALTQAKELADGQTGEPWERTAVHPLLWLRKSGEGWTLMLPRWIVLVIWGFGGRTQLQRRWVHALDPERSLQHVRALGWEHNFPVPCLVPWGAFSAVPAALVLQASQWAGSTEPTLERITRCPE